MILTSTIRQYLQEMRRDRVFIWTSRITLGMCLLGLFILILVWRKLPPQIPFFYSLPWGEEQLTEPINLIVFMLVSGLVYVGNLILGLFVKSKSLFLARLLLIGGMTFMLLAFYTCMRIIILIT